MVDETVKSLTDDVLLTQLELFRSEIARLRRIIIIGAAAIKASSEHSGWHEIADEMMSSMDRCGDEKLD